MKRPPPEERTSLTRAGTPARSKYNQEVPKMKYVCTVCGWVYDEDEAGVKWEDLPEDFACELCGVGKDMFEPEA